jgi:hypothetical protein
MESDKEFSLLVTNLSLEQREREGERERERATTHTWFSLIWIPQTKINFLDKSALRRGEKEINSFQQ